MKLKTLSKLTALLLAMMMLFTSVASADYHGLGSTGSDYDHLVSNKQQEKKAYCADAYCTYGWVAVNEHSSEDARYKYLTSLDADTMDKALNHFIQDHSGKVLDELCTCYINIGVFHPYGSSEHATSCPWYGDGETERTLTDVNNTGVTVTGNIPADVKLAVTTATGTRPTMDLSHFNTYLVYPTIKGYDIALLNADGTEYNLADGTTVTVNIPNAWNSSMVNPIADVYHMTGDANGTVEYKTSRNDSVILEGDYSITFETNGFSEYWIATGGVTLATLDNNGSHTVRIPAGKSVTVTVVDDAVTPNTSQPNVATATATPSSDGSSSVITITAATNARVGQTARIDLSWRSGYNSQRTAQVNVIIVSEGDVKAHYLDKFDGNTYKVYLAVRQDGGLPGEPSVQDAGKYSFFNSNYSSNGTTTFAQSANGIIDPAILDHDKFFYTSVDGTQTIGMVDSTGETIRTMVKGVDWDRLLTAAAGTGRITASNGTSVTSANVSNYKIVPYVIKCQEDSQGKGWHIDCAIVLKEAVMLSYDINIPAGLVIESDKVGVPNNETGTPPAKFTVGAMEGLTTIDGQANAIRVSPNYVFMFQGWNTKADGSGVWYQPGQDITINENTTLHAIWNSNPAIGTGNLEIRKIVRVDNGEEIDADQPFTFEVRIRNIEDGKEATGSYDYTIYGADGVAIPNGRGTIQSGGTVSLKHGQYVVIYDLPANDDKTNVQNVTITEIPVEGYTADWTDNTTTVAIQGGRRTETICYNTKAPSVGSLTITKVVEGVDNGAIPADTVFTFIVRDAKGTSQTVTVPANGSFTVENLPIGECTVTEAGHAEIPDYIFKQVTVNSTPAQSTTEIIVKDTNKTVTFTNVYEKATADLTITKKVEGTGAPAGDVFTFTVTLDDTPINGTYGDAAFTNGVATVTLMGGQSATIEDIPIGTQYTVTEASKAGYTTTSSDATGTIATGGATAAFTNTYHPGTLTITKHVTKADGVAIPTGTVFTFTVTLDPAVTGNFGYTVAGETNNAIFTNGVATIRLADGQTATFATLPSGVGYEVTETPLADYLLDTTYTTGTEGRIDVNTPSAAVFTNIHQFGNLVISKTVSGDDAPGGTFKFVVKLIDSNLNGTYGGATFINGVATFELTVAKGETKTVTIIGLPVGTKYTVTEDAVPGYTSTRIDATTTPGTIDAAGTDTVAFTNEYKTGKLSITKTVTSAAGVTAPYESFDFTVTLTDALGNALTGSYDYTVDNGGTNGSLTSGGTLTLKNGQTATFSKLPNGVKFKVEESADDDYVTSMTLNNTPVNATDGKYVVSGDIDTSTDKAVEFTNFYNYGNLTITKEVVGAPDGIDDQAFTICVSLPTKEGGYSYTNSNGTSGTVESNGMLTIKDDETLIIKSIKDGTSVTVEEISVPSYFEASVSTSPVTIDADATGEGANTVAITNTYKPGKLTITKNVEAANSVDVPTTDEFGFTVTLLKDVEGNPISGTFSYYKNDASDTLSTLALPNESNSLKLKDDESVTFTNLPVGATYTVVEAEHSDYELTAKTGDNGTITADGATAAFTNTYKYSDLKISKKVENGSGPLYALPDTTPAFAFTVTLTAPSDTTLKTPFTVEGAEGNTVVNGNVATVTFTLTDGQTATIKNIPVGTIYTVAETPVAGYITQVVKNSGAATNGASVEGTIAVNTVDTVAFTNTYSVGQLTISKEVNGADAPADEVFTFTVALPGTTGEFDYYVIDTKTKAAIEGKDGTITSTENTITLQHNQTAVIDRIPAGVEYTVTETADPDYTTTIKVSGVDAETGTGTITANNTSAVEFTNTYKYSHLTITKTGMKSGESAIVEVYVTTASTTKTYKLALSATMDTATISHLLIGSTYFVEELDGWSWLYTTGDPNYTDSSKTIVENGTQNTVTITNTPKNDKWLHDESGVINNLGNGSKKEIK